MINKGPYKKKSDSKESEKYRDEGDYHPSKSRASCEILHHPKIPRHMLDAEQVAALESAQYDHKPTHRTGIPRKNEPSKCNIF